MESYRASDDEVERLKAWLKENGTYVLSAVVIGLVLAFGVRFWRGHLETTREAAASLYGETLGWYSEGKTDAVKVAVAKLEQHYGSTPYAALGALLLGKISYDAGDLKQAAAALRWATAHALQPGVKAIAKLRLARVLIDERKLGSALDLVSPPAPAGFRAQYEEVRGDVLAQQGHALRARREYSAALQHLPAGSNYAPILKMKLENLKAAHS